MKFLVVKILFSFNVLKLGILPLYEVLNHRQNQLFDNVFPRTLVSLNLSSDETYSVNLFVFHVRNIYIKWRANRADRIYMFLLFDSLILEKSIQEIFSSFYSLPFEEHI